VANVPPDPAPVPAKESGPAREFRQKPFAAPAGALDLLLVRHGESAPFVPGRPFPLVDGQGDPELTDAGCDQAERVGARLARERVEALYVTTLVRTAQTAEPLARRTGLVPEVEADLREVHLGEWEGGLFRQHMAEDHPVAVRCRAEQRWELIPGAEPGEVLAARVRAAISRIAAAHAGRRVAAFTHGGVIAEVLRQASGSRGWAFLGAENGSISQIVVVGDQWIVRRFNDTAHLGSGLATAAAPLT